MGKNDIQITAKTVDTSSTQVAKTETGPLSGRVKEAKGGGGPARTQGTPSAKGEKALQGRSVRSGPAPEPRAARGGKVDTAKLNSGFRAAAEHLAKVPLSGGGKTDRVLMGFVEKVEAALRQPGAYSADDGSSIKDPEVLMDRLIDAAVSTARPEDRAALKQALETLRAKGALASALELADERRGSLEARIKENHVAFERTSDPAKMRLEDLPPSLRNSPEFTALMKDFSKALAKGGSGGAKAVADLAPRFNALYSKLSYANPKGERIADTSTQFRLSVTDGRALFQSMVDEAKKGASFLDRRSMESTLRKLGDGGIEAFHQATVENLGGSLSADGKTLVVGGKTYQRVGDDPLGNGAFGAVWRFRLDPPDPQVPDVVLKEPTGTDLIHGPASEVRSLATGLGTGTADTNIVGMVTAFQSGGKLFTVMPLMELGSFETQLGKLDANSSLDPTTKANLKLTPFAALAEGLIRLHAATGQVHSDVATRNVLIDGKGVGKVADFGLSKTMSTDGAKSQAKTDPVTGPTPVRWSPPESLLKQPLTAKSDSWMLGMTLFEVVYGHLPFLGMSNLEAAQAILEFDPSKPEHLPNIDTAKWPDGMADKLKGLFAMTLELDPEKRASVEEVLAQLKKDFPEVGTPETQGLLAAVLSSSPGSPTSQSDGSSGSDSQRYARSPVSNSPTTPSEEIYSNVEPPDNPSAEPRVGTEP